MRKVNQRMERVNVEGDVPAIPVPMTHCWKASMPSSNPNNITSMGIRFPQKA